MRAAQTASACSTSPDYRQHGQGEGRGLFGEPPFEALKALHDPQILAQQPQHWFIASGWRSPGAKPSPGAAQDPARQT